MLIQDRSRRWQSRSRVGRYRVAAQEGGRSPADVFPTENSNCLEQLSQRGMLAGVDAATLASVEEGKAWVHAAIAYLAPRYPGYIKDISGAAILKSSKHQAAAQEFRAYLTSQAGQNALAHSASFEYPIRAEVAADSALTPLAQLQPNSFDPAQLGTGLVAKTLLPEAGLL
jgi:ABC-type Fe3+ transport system substrate-binding protein